MYVNRKMEGPVKKKNAHALLVLTKSNGKNYAEVYQLDNKKKYRWGKIECGDGVAKDKWNGQGFWYYAGSERLYSKGKYKNGEKEGEWIYYFESGQTQSKGEYLNDKVTGLWRNYHDNGKISSILHYNVSGEKHGLQRFYPDQDDTMPRNYKEYANGKSHGFSKHYNKNNVLVSVYPYDKDSLNGLVQSFYPNGNPRLAKMYSDNGLVDSSVFYFPNGKTACIEYFKGKNQFDKYIWYDSLGNFLKSGTVQSETEYSMKDYKAEEKRFISFITNNYQYPEKARDKGVSCYLFITLNIDIAGNISIEKIENRYNTKGYGFEEEARRVINSFGKTIPMANHNLPEPVKLSLPIKLDVM